MKRRCLAMISAAAAIAAFAGPAVRTDHNRVRTGLSLDMKRIGTVKPLPLEKLGDAGWMIGCECLDRDYANFDEYKGYLPALGIKKLRLQTGWAKCEREKGKYDFSWLDPIVDWANANGFSPMLCICYGNPIYGGDKANGALTTLPTEGEYLEAWKRWQDALARHFAGRVRDWETWNEANNLKGATPKIVAENNLITAEIIKRHIPDARITGIVLGWLGGFEEILKEFRASGKGDLISYVSVHLYHINPEKKAPEIDTMLAQVAEILPTAKLRMSESGAPSEMLPSHGYSHWPFSEVSQAKLTLRRMLVDHSKGLDSSIFSISDMHYDKGLESIPFNNAKGILAANSAREIIRIKRAYYAVQNLVTLFDGTTLVPAAKRRFRNNDETVWFDEYVTAKGFPLIAFWQWHKRDSVNGELKRVATYPMPSESFDTRPFTFEATGKAFEHPVLVDVLSGRVYDFPMEDQVVHSRGIVYANVPVYDSPFVLTDLAALDGIFAAFGGGTAGKSIPAATYDSVAYGKHFRQVMDVWLPAGAMASTPIALYIHGGGFTKGDRRDRRLADRVPKFLDAGVAFASVDYRLLQDADGVKPPVKVCMDDIEAAIRFVKSKASAWNIDVSRIGLTGGSAGGCASLRMSLADDNALGIRAVFAQWPQTSLDPAEMREWIPNTTYGGRLFGYPDFKSWLDHRGDVLPWIEKYSPAVHLRKCDPKKAPVFFYTGPAAPPPGKLAKDPTHSGAFSDRFREIAAARGIPCRRGDDGDFIAALVRTAAKGER